MPAVETAPLGQGPLPLWADKHLGGEYELYAQLATRDGRRFGNGIIIEVQDETYNDVAHRVFVILTDFGNRVALSESQVERLFHYPEFRMRKELVDFRRQSMTAYLVLEKELARALQ